MGKETGTRLPWQRPRVMRTPRAASHVLAPPRPPALPGGSGLRDRLSHSSERHEGPGAGDRQALARWLSGQSTHSGSAPGQGQGPRLQAGPRPGGGTCGGQPIHAAPSHHPQVMGGAPRRTPTPPPPGGREGKLRLVVLVGARPSPSESGNEGCFFVCGFFNYSFQPRREPFSVTKLRKTPPRTRQEYEMGRVSAAI